MFLLSRRPVRWLLAIAVASLASLVQAQSLPVDIVVSGNTATVRIGTPSMPIADLSLNFDDASGLSVSSLGISAETVSLSDPALLARLSSLSLQTVPASLPVLITVEPPTLGGLSFRRLVNVEVHTHALVYTPGSRFRLFKAPLGGAFFDITGSVLPGSVRTRGTTPGFSQFLVLADPRPTSNVVVTKLAKLRDQVAAVQLPLRTSLSGYLDDVQAGVEAADFPAAITSLDAFRSLAASQAGLSIPQELRALHDTQNTAGELLAGADTLAFSIGFLRDYGN
jgi:hypothetical protein